MTSTLQGVGIGLGAVVEVVHYGEGLAAVILRSLKTYLYPFAILLYLLSRDVVRTIRFVKMAITCMRTPHYIMDH